MRSLLSTIKLIVLHVLSLVLGLACVARAQGFSARQFVAAVNGAYAIEVDSALLRRTAAEADVPVPARTLKVYVLPGRGFACGEDRCSGVWVQTTREDYIIVAEQRLEREPWLLRHEYLHHVLQTGDHPWTFQRLNIRTTDS